MVERQIGAEQLRLLYEHGRIAIVVNGLVAVLLVTLVGSSVPRHDVVLWSLLFALTWLPRGALYLVRSRWPNLVGDRVWLAAFATGTFVAGCTWGMTAVWLFPRAIEARFFDAVVVIGLSAGAVAGLSCVRGIYALYVFPAVLPIAFRFAFDGSASVPYAVIGLALLFCIGMTLAGHVNHRLLSSALRLRFKNAELAARLETLATHDVLTGLPNRLSLVERLNAALRRARRTHERLAVVFVDCDRFKEINDTYGHATGDEFLRRIAFALEKSVRETDTVARLGGDEFIVILEACGDRSSVETVVARMHERAVRAHAIGSVSITARLSIGVAWYPDDGAEPDTLIQRADHAMYGAKRSGGDAIVFYADSVRDGSR